MAGMGQLWNYILEEPLYEGSETQVRRARDATSGERLVVKLPVHDPPSLRTVGRLLHEHRILEKLAHLPGVLRTRGLTQHAGSAALWLEDTGLRSLDRVLAERGRLPIDAALRLAQALCRILVGVHAAGVVHKDVKPHNARRVLARRRGRGAGGLRTCCESIRMPRGAQRGAASRLKVRMSGAGPART